MQPRQRPRISTTLVIVLAGLLIAAGSLARWGSLISWTAAIRHVSDTGWQVGDGRITLTAAIMLLVVGLGVAFVNRRSIRVGLGVVGLMVTIAATWVAALDATRMGTMMIALGSTNTRYSSADWSIIESMTHTSVGPGVSLVIAGGIIGAIGAMMCVFLGGKPVGRHRVLRPMLPSEPSGFGARSPVPTTGPAE